MKKLYAPWRGTYTNDSRNQEKKAERIQDGKTVFTRYFEQPEKDAVHFILKRLPHTVIILNAYPYNPGHLLVVPKRQVAHLHELTQEELYELMDAINTSVKILEDTLGNSGTNVGLNLGDHASGGSIPEHLHVHIVPRWKGDTNFMPILAETKQLSHDLKQVYNKLLPKFNT